MIYNLCGIDEAGRGPLAGPLVVAGVVLQNQINGLDDSKIISEKKRQLLFDKIVKNSLYHIVFVCNKTIDNIGLSKALGKSIKEIMGTLKTTDYLVDGNTSFGIENLKHKIKADASIKEVSAASILAKVSRDKFMCDISHKYPQYNFATHKGYGTKAHILAIKNFGLSNLHRKSFKVKSLE
ncbi:Ribonuclease HII [hydrothermal vent metagenome]|uniref:Ribonuclease HII n=1 Tax=hydrothermal vent metagenome TaxID=652676 RepID=A0A3B1E6E9_9ZZZZ